MALAVVLGACTSTGDQATPDASVITPAEESAPRLAATAVIDAAPLPETVPVMRPDLRLDGVAVDTADRVRGVAGVDGVLAAAMLDIRVPTVDGLQAMRALVVDPHSFRTYAPDVTANEPGVWDRLEAGEVVITPATADRTDALLGEALTLSTSQGSLATRVGAFAANGVPQLADALIPWEVGRALGADGADTLFVSVSSDASLSAVVDAVAERTGIAPEVLEEPATQAARASGSSVLESFTYQSLGDGQIRIDPSWTSRNLAYMDVPILGRVYCHRVMLPQLHAALVEIQQRGLGHLITQYSGCHVPRHILWDPSRGISQHAWGLAFDINVPGNQYGATPTLDMRIVEIFRSWGFTWGGDFSTPDGMHFELSRIVQP